MIRSRSCCTILPCLTAANTLETGSAGLAGETVNTRRTLLSTLYAEKDKALLATPDRVFDDDFQICVLCKVESQA
jgi:hypothetical protein